MSVVVGVVVVVEKHRSHRSGQNCRDVVAAAWRPLIAGLQRIRLFQLGSWQQIQADGVRVVVE